MILSQNDPRFSEFQNIKRRFFALRNGVVADRLRSAGDPHRIIFGLNLPQLHEIADGHGPDGDMAQTLWQNRSTRESRLLATMLFDVQCIDMKSAIELAKDTICQEEADILCHSLLRMHPQAWQIAFEMTRQQMPQSVYCGLRLMFNLLNANPILLAPQVHAVAERFVGHSDMQVSALATTLDNESRFWL